MIEAPLNPPARAAEARGTRRWSFAFGPRFPYILLAGFVWVGPAWFDSRYLAALVAWDAAAFVAWWLDLRRIPEPGALVVTRSFEDALALESDVRVRIEVANKGGRAITARLLDEVPVALRGAPPELTFDVAAGSRAMAGYAIRPQRRGNTSFGMAWLRYVSTMGLAERWAVAPIEQTIRVYPNLETSRRLTLYLTRGRQAGHERLHKRQRGAGREFESLREYRDGDQWRDVCWTATARRGRLISRVYRIERDQVVWIVVDAGRLLQASAGSLTKLDHAASAALGVAQVALHSGDRVGLLTYGRRVQQRVPPASGAGHLRLLLEALTDVRSERSEADHLGAARALLQVQKRRALVIWLTDLADTATTPDVVQGAMQIGSQHLVIFVAIGQTTLWTAAEDAPKDARAMYRYVAALEVLERRQLLLGNLRRGGAWIADVQAGSLAVAMVNQYLQIKERGLL
ncbi:MAG TPA: DUF58 domain-containing protein [Candidatus Polarisedimenticolia bacterium]|nr:DUF58 domain-containing protein [Candidatus Polarisedimenticolia bacterium]